MSIPQRFAGFRYLAGQRRRSEIDAAVGRKRKKVVNVINLIQVYTVPRSAGFKAPQMELI